MIELHDLADPHCPDGFDGFFEVQANFREAMGIRAEAQALSAHFRIPSQDECIGHDIPGGFPQPGDIHIQRQVAGNAGFQYGTDHFLVAGWFVSEDRGAGASGDVKVGDDIDVGGADHLVQFGEIASVNFVRAVGPEIFGIEYEIGADIMHGTDHIVERSPLEHFFRFLWIEMRFSDFDPGADNQLPVEQLAHALQFCVPGFWFEIARLGLVWTDIPVLGKPDFRDSEFDRPPAHAFWRIVSIFREAAVHMIVGRNFHDVGMKRVMGRGRARMDADGLI
jgi:hypothetical protein